MQRQENEIAEIIKKRKLDDKNFDEKVDFYYSYLEPVILED